VKCLEEKKHLLLFVGSRIENFVKKKSQRRSKKRKEKFLLPIQHFQIKNVTQIERRKWGWGI